MAESTQQQEPIWEQAHHYAHSFGNYTAAFTTTIRTLLLNQEANLSSKQQSLDASSRFLTLRLLRSPSILSHFYYATTMLHGDRLTKLNSVKTEDLIRLYGPQELSSLLAIIYLTRRIEGRCDPEEWKVLVKGMQLSVDLGAYLGEVIPAIGPQRGILIGASRHLAWGTFALADPKLFKKYRVTLKMRRVFSDLELEIQNWGTTHAHVASILFQSMGMGTEYANEIFLALSNTNEALLDDEALRLRTTRLWLDPLAASGEPPEETLGDDYLLAEDRIDEFVDRVDALRKQGSPTNWLSKRKSDIGPDKTPQLIFELPRKKQTPTQRTNGDPEDTLGLDFVYHDLSEKFRAAFKEEDLLQLMAEIQQLLAEAEAPLSP